MRRAIWTALRVWLFATVASWVFPEARPVERFIAGCALVILAHVASERER